MPGLSLVSGGIIKKGGRLYSSVLLLIKIALVFVCRSIAWSYSEKEKVHRTSSQPCSERYCSCCKISSWQRYFIVLCAHHLLKKYCFQSIVDKYLVFLKPWWHNIKNFVSDSWEILQNVLNFFKKLSIWCLLLYLGGKTNRESIEKKIAHNKCCQLLSVTFVLSKD